MHQRVPHLVWAIAGLVVLCIAGTHLASVSSRHPLSMYVACAILLTALLAMFVRTAPADTTARPWSCNAPTWMLPIAIGAMSFNVSYHTARAFGDLPPALHDEYSYLYQAKTFLKGRLSSPSPAPGRALFDQIHVLNHARFASRYFPGTGLWIAPFLVIGSPYLGQWLAAAVSSMLVFACGQELSGPRAGLFAGTVLALSPGMAIFANLLTASQPCLLGLTIFLFGVLRLRRTWRARWAVLSGSGLAFAMLCRPLTAAGAAAPFGIWFVWRLFRNQQLDVASRVRLFAGMVVPLIVGLCWLGAYNRALTGDVWTTPYQLYNQIYTPAHSYGYHNVVRGRTAAGPNVDRDYNDWAIDLTFAGSLRNCRQRLLQSWAWTIGILPIGIAVAVVVSLRRQLDTFFWLFPASVLTLHAAYLPYWFVGLFDFHYVFESTAAWALVAGIAGDSLLRFGTMTGRRLVPGWLMLVAVAAVSRNLISLDVTGPSLLSAGIRKIEPMRIRHALFLRLIEENVQERPAVVYVPDPPMDLHVDFVINDPDLDGDVLFARLRDPAELEVPFRGRAKYLFDERRWTISRYSASRFAQPAGEEPNQTGTHQ